MKKLTKQDKQGLVMIVAAVLIMLSLMIASAILKEDIRYDPETFCPDNKEYRHTIIIIDKTDMLTESQRRFIFDYIKGVKDNLQLYEKLSIFTLTDRNYKFPIPVFSKCNPGTGKDANELYQNPRKIRKKFNDFFEKPLDKILTTVLDKNTSPQTPLFEMLQEISFRRDFGPKVINKQLIIISDMLHHMPQYSHYNDKVDYNQFSKSEYADTITSSLQGVDVKILYLWRPKYKKIQSKNHILFWAKFFDDMGANIKEIRRIR